MNQQMTQSQTRLKPVKFFAATGISEWAGRTNGIMYLEGDPKMPYVEAGGMYYYFGQRRDGYHLLCSCSRDLMRID